MDYTDLEQHFKTCMPIFIALGDEVRLHIIKALMTEKLKCSVGLNVKQITEHTSLSRPAVSHHLRILKDAGLVNIQRHKTSNLYYLTICESTNELMQLGNSLQKILDSFPVK